MPGWPKQRITKTSTKVPMISETRLSGQVADVRGGAEHGQLEALVLGGLEVVPVMDGHEAGTDHGADQLTGDVRRNPVPR